MQKLLTFVLLLSVTAIYGQVEVPAPSPFSKLEQKVGLTDVTVEYSRPGAKNRLIFGELVPFGEMWRTGANASTKITFSEDVKIEGVEVEKGTYALYSVPGEEEWEIVLYKDLTHWGVPTEYDAEQEALRVTVMSEEVPWTIETFTIDIGSLRDAAAVMTLSWESTMVPVKIQFKTESMVEKKIAEVLAGPTGRDYYLSARYYFSNDKDLEQAREWIQIANDKDPKFWQLRLESLIHAKLDDIDSAIAAAKKSLEMAEKAGNANYVRMNKASIEEWTAPQEDEMMEEEPANEGGSEE